MSNPSITISEPPRSPENLSNEDSNQKLFLYQQELNALLVCEEVEPDIQEIKQRIQKNPEILCPLPPSINGDKSVHHVAIRYTYLDFPLFKAVNVVRQDEEKDMELIQYLIEEGLKLESNVYMEGSKGGLLLEISRIKPSPLTILGLRNKFKVLEYLAKRDPQILDHGDIHNIFCKCFYYDNRGAIPRLFKIFPTFLRNDMDLDCRGIERFVVHSAIGFLDTFQDVVEAGLRQIPDRERGVITGEVLQILVSRRFITGLNFLFNYEPPLLRPEDVLEFDLMASLFAMDKNGRNLDYIEAVAQIFQLLLDLDPQAIAKRFMYRGHQALPIHIFCDYIMDAEILDDNDFYAILERVLTLGVQEGVGGIGGHGGIVEPFNGTIPAKKLFRYIRTGDWSMFQAALSCDTNVLDRETFMWFRDTFIPDILENMDPALLRSRDHVGRLPLHNCVDNKAMDFGSIRMLFQGNESAVAECDPVTGLLPALLSASMQEEERTAGNQLSTVFFLFRKSPVFPL